ncbi:MAG: 3-dehydroquinate synthase, partial [Bacteroidetes bacterium]
MGGFCAATYKRGIAFIQIPTTLLSQVDASVGGKLGIDFQGLKNHIGVFQEPAGVYIYPGFLESLSERELLSGFAEVIKHCLIADKAGWEDLRKTQELRTLDFEAIILHSVRIKADIVAQDPLEKGIRKALNFGHTLGHAVESYFLSSPDPLLHGEAIAIGMICETWISGHRHLLKSPEIEQITQFLLSLYPHRPVPQDAYFDIEALTRGDKKNEGGRVLCTLLDGIGQVLYNEEISPEEIFVSLDYYNSSLSV